MWNPLIVMKMLGHTDYQITANSYTHLKSEMMKKNSVDIEDVFRRKQEPKVCWLKCRLQGTYVPESQY